MMAMEWTIAVVVGKDGGAASLLEAGVCVRIYRRNRGEWEVLREVPVALHPENGLAAVRGEIQEIVRALGDTRIVVAGQISGVPYNTFDAAGYSIFEIQGRPEQFLEFVAHEIRKEQEVPKASEEIPASQPAGEDGNYFLDLAQAQLEHPNATTKQMLLPFFEKTTFYQLELVCSHIPPWFERQFSTLRLAYEKEQLGPGKYKVTVHPTACAE